MPNLCVTCTFNPPSIKVMGATLREETIHKLEQKLPTLTTTSASVAAGKESGFVFIPQPAHWSLTMNQHFCDQLGRSLVFMSVIECLEGEDWKLRATNCMSHYDSGKDTTKLFFSRN